jgi:ABC-type lipoprotein release transport system permease subunit
VLLYGVTPLDTASYVVSTGLLLMVATAAAFIPAVRAGRVSPTEALRSE